MNPLPLPQAPFPFDIVRASTQAGTLTLGFDGHANLSFDGEGRLVGAWLKRITYRRALDNRVLAKWMGEDGLRQRRFLTADEGQLLIDLVYAQARTLALALAKGERTLGEGQEAVQKWLGRVADWNWSRLAREERRFHQVYKPIPILPPDQYLSVVVQATEGCSYNECSFCTFYRDRPFRIKGQTELAQHLAQVGAFLGRGLSMRRALFLADANAVLVAQRRLTEMLAQINQPWSDDAPSPMQHGLDGIYAFMSAPDAQHKTAQEFAELAGLGLRRVYVGLESGHDPLRVFLRKQGSREDVLEAVERLKAGGLAVGLMVMVGVGGEAFRQGHFDDTLDLLTSMPLGTGDIVYWSPFVASPDAPYVTDVSHANIAPMDDRAIRAEMERFRTALRPWARRRGVKQSLYDIREFIY